jgi:hypothetical protein
MNNAAFVLATLLLFIANGIPLQSLSVRSWRRQLAAAPVIGSCVLAISTTIFYRFGVSPSVTVVFVSVVSAAVGAARLLAILKRCCDGDGEWHFGAAGVATLGCFTVVFSAIVLPHVIGGENFSAFQGNPHDTFNYLSAAVGYATHSYSDFLNDSIHPYATLLSAADQLTARPTVAILYAGVYRALGANYLSHAYDFCSALQINLFFSFLYLTGILFSHRPIATALASSAFGIGFFAQYVFDINAWSELLALPMVVVLLVDFARLLVLTGKRAVLPAVPTGKIALVNDAVSIIQLRDTELPFLLGRITIIAAGLTYSYPEIASMAALASVSALICALRTYVRFGRIASVRRLAIYCGILALAVLGIVSLFWHSIVGFLLGQISFAAGSKVNWHMFFQAYLMGVDQNNFVELAGPGAWWTKPYTLLSLPSDFLSAFMGLYFLQPHSYWPLWIRVIYKLWVLFGCILVVIGVTRTMAAVFSKQHGLLGGRRLQLRYILVAAGCTFAIPAYFLANGQYWSAGKAISMLSLFVYLALVIPVLLPAPLVGVRMLSWSIVAAHILFGFYRPYAVWKEGNGIHYDYPYPTIRGPMKTEIDWDIARHYSTLVRCNLVKVDIDNPFLERAAENYLIDQKITWFTSRPQTSYYGAGRDIGAVSAPIGQREECLLTNVPTATDVPRIVIDLRRLTNN